MKIKIDLTEKEQNYPTQKLKAEISEYLERHGKKLEHIEKLNPRLVEVEVDSK